MKKNIQEITPWLAYYFIDTAVEAQAYENYAKLVKKNAKRFGLFTPYLGQLHDSQIIKNELIENTFSITLNDYRTHLFSRVLVYRKQLEINLDKLQFPLQLEFEIIDLSFNTVDEEGTIHPIKITSVNEYLNQQVISVDRDSFKMALIVWKDGIDEQPGQEILILLNAKSITTTELQEQAWNEVFGDTYAGYYNYFKSQIAKGRDLTDRAKCNKIVSEYDRTKQ